MGQEAYRSKTYPGDSRMPVAEDSPSARPRNGDRDQMELILPFSGSGGLRAEDGVVKDPRFLRMG